VLNHTDRNVRANAAASLGQIGDPRAIEPLALALIEQDDSVYYEAANALGQLGDARGIDVLITALKDSNSYVRYQAANALGKLGDRRALPALQWVAENDTSRPFNERMSDVAARAIKTIEH
jgi:HEAT repeat protein